MARSAVVVAALAAVRGIVELCGEPVPLFVLAEVLSVSPAFLESIVVVRTEYRTKGGEDPCEDFARVVFGTPGICVESGITTFFGAVVFDVASREVVGGECLAAKLCTLILIVVKLSLIDCTASSLLDRSSFDARDLEKAAVCDDGDAEDVVRNISLFEEIRSG